MISMNARRAGRPGVAAERDAYGQEIWSCYKGISPFEIIERDDGFVDIGSAFPYFQAFENWPQHEQEAIHLARGPVLDIGCGAGRVALYLQGKGHRVVAIDNSPMAVKVTRLRGVKWLVFYLSTAFTRSRKSSARLFCMGTTLDCWAV